MNRVMKIPAWNYSRIIVSAVAVFCIIMQASPESVAQTRLQVVGGDTVNWGNVSPGTLKRDISIRNVGVDTLHITEVVPGCGCTTAPLGKKVLGPGESTIIPISLNVVGHTGEQRKYIRVVSDDPVTPEKRLTLLAFVEQDLSSPQPYFPFMRDGIIGEEQSTAVAVVNVGREPVVIQPPVVIPGSTTMKVRFSPAEPRTLKPGDTLDVTAHVTPLASGPLSAQIILRSNGKNTPELRFHLFCTVPKSPTNSPEASAAR